MKEHLHFKKLENTDRKKIFLHRKHNSLQTLLYSFSALEELVPNSSVNCKGKNHDTFWFALKTRKEVRTIEIAFFFRNLKLAKNTLGTLASNFFLRISQTKENFESRDCIFN